MLILTRRLGESVIISHGLREIRITVLARRGRQVSLGIDAPDDVEVNRAEIHERVRYERAHGQVKAGR
jgi:carbon storage regulator